MGSKSKGSGIFLKLYLLFWKNLIIIKRQYIITALEIILPTLFAIGLAYIKSKIAFDPYVNEEPQFFYEYDEDSLISNAAWYRYSYGESTTYVIGYTPKSAEGQEVMEKFVRKMYELYPPYDFGNPWEPPRPPPKTNVTGFATEGEMEAFQIANSRGGYGSWERNESFEFGVVFETLSDSKVHYKLRTSSSDFYLGTKELMSSNIFPGPGYGYQSYNWGFLGLQMVMDKTISEHYGTILRHKTNVQPFPYPPYKDADLSNLYEIFLPIFVVLGFVFVCPTVVRGVVSEKETGIKELMKMSGLPEWMHWLGWMLNSLMLLIIAITIIVIILFIPFNSEAGAVFQHSDPFLLWVILLWYSIWATTYCFMISAFFERPTLATTASIMIWMVSFFGLGVAMENSYGQDFSLGLKLLFCLFPNVGLHMCFKVYCSFEAAEKGAKWSNLGESISGTDAMAMWHALVMLIASTCLNTIICLYVEAVMPKKYGVRKPLYFIFQPSEWGIGKKSNNDKDFGSNKEPAKPSFEEEPTSIKPRIELKKLRKEFGKGKVAVDDMSMKIYENQIFCLLGQNGAGKTTTMSILTGLFAPTSGTALINGLDIRTDMTKIRESLGLCPQHNMLFDKMTVVEHLKFFGMLKGLSGNAAHEAAKSILDLLQIPEKKNDLAMSLSGGQKRRLMLGCALVGDSKVVFLDEPTSGMDPEARRAIWDLLLKIRDKCTIVLTTHFMEEADVLGDRIAIMASGVLQCCGSPGFLKRYYGAGFTLSMTAGSGARRDMILNAVQRYVPDAQFKTSLSSSTEISIILPSEKDITAKFPDMFSELTHRQKELGIDEIGVGWTTMDEVFVKVEELSHNDVNGNGSVGSDELTESNSNGAAESQERIFVDASSKATGLSLLFSQFKGLLVKKFLYAIRRKRLILSQTLIPILLTIAAVSVSRTLVAPQDKYPPLKISLSPYKSPVTLYSSNDPNLGNSYASVVGSSAKLVNYNLSQALLDVGMDDVSVFRERHIIAAEIINSTHTRAMHSTIAYHSPPLAVNMLTNAMLRNAGSKLSIEVTNHPFSDSYWELFEPGMDHSDISLIISIVFGVLVSVGMILLVGTFLISPTEERLCKGKQLQMMTGVNPLLYWCSCFIVDYLMLIVTVSIMTACLPILQSGKMFTNHDGAAVFVLIMVVYGIATLSFTYVFTTFVRTVPGGFALLTIVHTLTGIGLGVASFVVDNFTEAKEAITFVNVLGRFFPSYGMTKAAINYAKTSVNNGRCEALSEHALSILCDENFETGYWYSDLPQDCCPNCRNLGDKRCFKPEPHFVWSTQRAYLDYTVYPPVRKILTIPGLSQDLVWLAVLAVVNFIILMIIEYDVFKMIFEKATKEGESNFRSTVQDNDVIEENERVKHLVKNGRSADDAIVVDNLCKSFGNFSAVSKLSFGVNRGECFGLLGVNGAGKTTTFRMLTGDEVRSNGNAYINNLSLVNGRKEFLGQLGYCPQFDGIIGCLTGKEMLCLFGRLRGINGKRVEEEAKKWLLRAGLDESKNVRCQKYSGGMKRRLSAAMALVGSPPVVLLDEPTSGVDPIARRQFWKIISSLKNSGQSIILTSHSMEECEALCSRLGIMVNGEMHCIGGVQHLKNKFAQGYSLTVKLNENCLENSDLIKNIIETVIQNFEPCSLKDNHQTQMKFQIHSESQKWEHLYRKMEGIKLHFQGQIEEYAITETTLEEVFLSFARQQHSNDRTTAGRGRLCGLCA